jgi:hypothetical protein
MIQRTLFSDPPKPPKPRRRRRPLALVKRDDGWYLDAETITPDVPEWGPWTKAEAREARRSYLRNHVR